MYDCCRVRTAHVTLTAIHFVSEHLSPVGLNMAAATAGREPRHDQNRGRMC
jgi:hypothetical protein